MPPGPAPPTQRPAYTVRDTPEVVARVDGDLEAILDAVRRADPGLRALVLSGGFARGEGGVLRGQPQNDYDLVALRGLAPPPRGAYARVRAALEPRLGLHLDLQPVWEGRLPWVRPSVFWYETALRGRVLWGPGDLLARIPVRDAAQLDPTEGLRLLVNRAAGLLLARPERDPHLHRIQASKGFLAAMDAHLLARGLFAPSQRERWTAFAGLKGREGLPEPMADRLAWLEWAFRFKVDPERAGEPDAEAAWREAALAILDAVPDALRCAGLRGLEEYARADRLTDNVVWRVRALGHAEAARSSRWLARHATGRLRVATLALLRDTVEGMPEGPRARRELALLTKPRGDPVRTLARLRAVMMC
jgi:hypothetical protein